MVLAKYLVATLKDRDTGKIRVYGREIDNTVAILGLLWENQREENPTNEEVLEWKPALTRFGAKRIFNKMHKHHYTGKVKVKYNPELNW